jgi:DNA-binding NarL/FixJ family response regulator
MSEMCQIEPQNHAGVRVLLADDHGILRDGLRSVLNERNMEVVAEASDGLQAVELCKKLAPEIAVIDISMPIMNGIAAASEIRKVSPNTKVMILTMHTEDRYVFAALRAGVSAYILKSKTVSNLLQAIEDVSNGDVYLSSGISKSLVNAYLAADADSGPLSTREREVLQFLAEGKNAKEIAAALGISTKTAETHRANMMRKLGINDMIGLIRYAIKEGLIQVE